MKKYLLFIVLITWVFFNNRTQAQPKIDIDKISKSEIVKLSYEVLLDLPLEDLKKLAEIVGVSPDELLKIALNQEVSAASKKGESLFESPLSASVITKEELRLTGATTVEEALRFIQGIIVRQETNGNFDVHIRGNDNLPSGNMSHFSENTLTLVMIDNRIVYNYMNGGTIWESLPISLTDVERIEVVRGPSSALYGPNAVSGVINIITRKPEEDGIKANVDIQAGSYTSLLANAVLLHKINNKFQWKAYTSFDIRGRFVTDFYEFLRQEYLPVDSLTSMFNNIYFAKSRDTELAKDGKKGGVTLYYNPTAFSLLSLSMGMEDSRAQSIYFENLATPLCIRNSTTGYVDFRAQLKKLSAQLNYMAGDQNLHEYMLKPVVHYNMSFLTGNLEYDWALNNLGIGQLTLRPGMNFQRAEYDDSKQISDYQQEYNNPQLGGLLGEAKHLSTISGNLRLDYRPLSELRIFGAVRLDKFNKPDKSYLSYQGGASYLLNSRNMVRFVTSKAYRSPFMGDMFANYKNWLGVQSGLNLYQVYAGFESPENSFDYTLTSQTLYEIGYRGIFTDWLQLDIEGFFTESKNFTALMPRSNPEIRFNDVLNQYEILSIWEYQNLKMVARQTGVSGVISINPIDKMVMKVFATVQQTKLTDAPNNILQDSLISQTHKNTPGFYGGMSLNYSFLNRWNFNTSLYAFSEQTYSRYRFILSENRHSTMSATIKPNAIINCKLSYNVYQNSTLFINVRNINLSQNPEFAYSDKIKPLILFGINIVL